MNSISNDHRFSRAFTDPRFRPMPTLQKKVKIDKRFKAVLSSKDYGHRLHHDKRGRPIHDLSKKGKHEMERYYQISSDDSSDDDDEEDEQEDSQSQSQEEDASDADSPAVTKPSLKKKLKETEHEKKSVKQKKRIDGEDEQSPKKKSPGIVKPVSDKQKKPSKKRSLVEEDDDDSFQEKPTPKRLKKNGDVSDKMKSSVKKRAMKVDKDDEKIILKRSKNVEEEVSVNDDDEHEDVDEEDIDSDEEESSDSDDSSDEEEEVSGDEGEEEEVDTSKFITVMKPSTSVDHSWNELHRKAPLVSDSTHRLAVCNMDWDFVKAQDLFVLFKSFAGEGGAVRSVTIYPSEFGKERIVEDAALGPREMRGGLNEDEDQTESDDDDEDEEDAQQRRRKKNRKIDSEIMKRKAKEAAKAANEALRGYQLNRLRYYFAVVDCSSVDTADTIYKECDGMEYQLSSIRVDLRYIPDDMTFDDPPKDSFSDEHGLVDFQPNYFLSTALSQGKVNVTWDETEFDRIRNKITKAQRDELEQIVEENRYADTIAPPESDSDLEDEERPQWLKTALGLDDEEDDSDNNDSKTISEEKRISLYRKVLMDKIVEDEQKDKLKKEKSSEVDKELKWTSGLKTAYEDKLKKSEKIKEESQGVIVDKYLERKREKRRNRAKKKSDFEKGGEGDSGEEGVDNDMPDIIDDSLRELMESEGHDVSTVKSSKKKKDEKKKKKASKETEDDREAEREKAELELLLMRDEGEEKKIPKPERVKEKLSRRQKKKLAMKKSERRKERKEGRLTIDVEDERFGAMFTSHHFHLDPNHGQFRKTKNNMKLLDEQIKRMSTKSKNKNSGKSGGEIVEVSEDSRSVTKNLVESLKRKMKK